MTVILERVPGCAVCASSARSFVVEEVFVWQLEP